MIFAYTLDLVLSGKKTQTRRVIKPDEQLQVTPDGHRVIVPGKRTVYQVGKTYAVQPGRTAASVARIRLTGLRREPVEAISEGDAQAEGYGSREEFFAVWRRIHGAQADLARDVWVLEFELTV
jgi:hypothetical protein